MKQKHASLFVLGITTKYSFNNNKTDAMKNEFQTGNKAAEKWTETNAVLVLNKMLDVLWRCDKTGERATNPVRANLIKLRKELCLLTNLTQRQWQYLKTKFTNTSSAYFNEDVAIIIQKIEETCECRLINSGTTIDILVLKTHYGYSDQKDKKKNANQQNITTGIVVPQILIVSRT